jgi:hypothetical protein
MVNCVADAVHPEKSIKRSEQAKNYRKGIEERTRESGPRAHGNTIVRQER